MPMYYAFCENSILDSGNNMELLNFENNEICRASKVSEEVRLHSRKTRTFMNPNHTAAARNNINIEITKGVLYLLQFNFNYNASIQLFSQCLITAFSTSNMLFGRFIDLVRICPKMLYAHRTSHTDQRPSSELKLRVDVFPIGTEYWIFIRTECNKDEHNL